MEESSTESHQWINPNDVVKLRCKKRRKNNSRNDIKGKTTKGLRNSTQRLNILVNKENALPSEQGRKRCSPQVSDAEEAIQKVRVLVFSLTCISTDAYYWNSPVHSSATLLTRRNSRSGTLLLMRRSWRTSNYFLLPILSFISLVSNTGSTRTWPCWLEPEV